MNASDCQALDFYTAELRRLARYMPPDGEFCGDKRVQTYYRETFTAYLCALLEIHRENASPLVGAQCAACRYSLEYIGCFRCGKDESLKVAESETEDAPCVHYRESPVKAARRAELMRWYPITPAMALCMRPYEYEYYGGRMIARGVNIVNAHARL